MKLRFFMLVLSLLQSVLIGPASATDWLMSRFNLARTGLNNTETILTPALVSSVSFGLLWTHAVNGQVYAQPLYVSNQLTRGKHNVLYVATENDFVYAVDADSGKQYWVTNVAPAGETAVLASLLASDDLVPLIGITATPVIDRSAGPNGTIFLVAFTTDNAGHYFYRLHALDLATGAERLPPSLINPPTYPGIGPANVFRAQFQRSRAGLLLLNGLIYTCWAGFNDNPPYAGWIISYNEADLSLRTFFNADPNGPANYPSTFPSGGSGNGIWQAGSGPAVDSEGFVFVATGNGPFDANGDFGDSVLKMFVSSNTIFVYDSFTPFDQFNSSLSDRDLASGGPMVLDFPQSGGTILKLLYQAGKDGHIYLLNRNNLGKFNSSNNSQIYQDLPGATTGLWSSPAYFNGSVYVGQGPLDGTGPMLQFSFNFSSPSFPFLNPTPASQTTTIFGYPGATPTISSNGLANGIVWAYERNQSTTNAFLHAYNPANLAQQYFVSPNLGGGIKFATPTVCNGKVYVGTDGAVAAFGKK